MILKNKHIDYASKNSLLLYKVDNFTFNLQSRYESKQMWAMHYGRKSCYKHKIRASIGSIWWEFERWKCPGWKTELRYFNREKLMRETSHKSDRRAEKAIRGQWSNLVLTTGRKLLLFPQPEGQREEVVGPEFRRSGEGWNHDRDEALPKLSHKAERERKRNTLVFPLHTLQSPVIVSLVVHSN